MSNCIKSLFKSRALYFVSVFILLIVFLLLVFLRDHYILSVLLIRSRWIFYLVAIYVLSQWRIRSKLFSVFAGVFLIYFLSLVIHEQPNLNNEIRKVGSSLKVISYNLFLINGEKEDDTNMLLKQDPDILLLQEVTPQWHKILSKKLKTNYPYSKSEIFEGVHGLSVYSKTPICFYKPLFVQSEIPAAQGVGTMMEGKPFLFFNIHLASPAMAFHRERSLFWYKKIYDIRKIQLDSLQAFSRQYMSQFDTQIIGGDFNTMREEPIFRAMEKEWVDAYQNAGRGMGYNWPSGKYCIPFVGLDHLLLKGNAVWREFRILKQGHSDHLPVIGILEF